MTTRCNTDTVITSAEDIARLLKNFSLIGGGGTDFRPAFAYVNRLLDEGVFHNLKGLLYFTDGKGIYPAKRPPYETAFVFIDRHQSGAHPSSEQDALTSESGFGAAGYLPEVPAWAMKIHWMKMIWAYDRPVIRFIGTTFRPGHPLPVRHNIYQCIYLGDNNL